MCCASFRNSWAAANRWHLDVCIYFFTNQHFRCGSCFGFDHEPFTIYGDSIAFAVPTAVSGDEFFFRERYSLFHILSCVLGPQFGHKKKILIFQLQNFHVSAKRNHIIHV